MSGLLTHSPADVVRQVLIDLGVGSDPDASPPAEWPVFAAGEPPTPDEVITVYDTAGRDGGREMVGGERAEFHGLQVRVRGATAPRGAAKANSVAVALDQKVRRTSVRVDAGTYLVWAVTRTGGVLSLGDESPTSKRSLYTLNAVVSLRQTS